MSDQTDYIAEAKSMGWVPAEEFRGDPSKWADAETFVKRGEQFMPLLKANNNRLKSEYQKLEQEVRGLKSLLTASHEAIEELKAFHSEDTKAKVAAVKQQLLEQLKIAKNDGDTEAETRLTEELIDLKAAQREPAKPAPAKPSAAAPAEPQVDPELTAWMAKPGNEWFGSNRRKTQLAFGIAEELRADPSNDHLIGQAFYDRVAEEVAETLGETRSVPSKVASSRGGSGGSSGAGNGKSYADLPPEAKAACEDQARKLVGDGRAFKDTASWRKYYAEVFFSQGE